LENSFRPPLSTSLWSTALICGILRKLERGGYGKRKKEDEKREIVKKKMEQMRGRAMGD